MRAITYLGFALIITGSMILSGGAAFSDRENPAPQTKEALQQSVVLVAHPNGHGSGAVINETQVLTAKHVARHENLTVQTQDGDAPRHVINVTEDPNSDAAILTVDRPFDANEPPLTVDPTPLNVGDPIVVIGTPLDKRLFNCVIPGVVIKTDVPLDGPNYTITNTIRAPGTSGGPVVDNKGRIRAIHTNGVPPYSGELPAGEFKRDLGL